MSEESEELNQRVHEARGRGPEYALVKRGLYFRPNAAGYTDNLAEAGRYTKQEADRWADDRGEEPTFARLLPPPDYAHDLNLCAELRQELDHDEQFRFGVFIGELFKTKELKAELFRTREEFHVANLTAEQNCRAYLYAKEQEE